ncbi:MAG TPA: alpha/beta hydrolase, partial [Chitinophaga sp.]
MIRRTLLLWIFFLVCTLSYAQDRYTFTRGLISGPSHQYGRQALFTDQLAYLLYAGQPGTPAAGGSVPGLDNTPGKWNPIEADSAGMFKGRLINNGYLYLTYDAPAAQTAVLNITGHQMVYVNGEPHAGDIYRYGWMYTPVQLKKGLNEFYVRTARSFGRQGIQAQLLFPAKPVYLSTADSTLPFIVTGKSNTELWGAVVIINTSKQALKGLQISAGIQGKEVVSTLPDIAPMSTRKVGFKMDASQLQQKGTASCALTLTG